MAALPDTPGAFAHSPPRLLEAAPLPPPPVWTVPEYFLLEEIAQRKFEYLDGQIYSMSGGTSNHSEIKVNLVFELGRRLRDSDCWMRDSDMRLKVNQQRYVYPDLSVVCGHAQLEDNATTLTNPTVVVEVASASTSGYDRATKLHFYRSLPSVQAYLIIDQGQILAELHSRSDSGWLWQTFSELSDYVPLEALGCRIALADIYRGITFTGA